MPQLHLAFFCQLCHARRTIKDAGLSFLKAESPAGALRLWHQDSFVRSSRQEPCRPARAFRLQLREQVRKACMSSACSAAHSHAAMQFWKQTLNLDSNSG